MIHSHCTSQLGGNAWQPSPSSCCLLCPQCLGPNAPVTPKPTPTPTCKKFVAQGQQCGGKGAQCEFDLGVCADSPAPGVCCEAGYSCVAQNEWYWGCKQN